jgi:hypothetical protein
MRRWLPLGLLAALLFGCDTAPSYRPRSLQTVTLARDRPAALELEVVTGVRVVLPDPDPGYVWEIIANNIKVLPQTSALRPDPGGGTESVTFYAARPGRSVLRFAMVHPHDLDAEPAAKAALTVHVTD